MHNRHRKESFGDELLVSIENANVYIPISKSAMYPNISVESVLFTLPLYLKKFSGLQDLLIDYVNEGVAAYSKYNQFKTQITGHHRSSSSFTTMGQMGMTVSDDDQDGFLTLPLPGYREDEVWLEAYYSHASALETPVSIPIK